MTVAWQSELQRACEAADWLVVESRGDGAAWGCLLLYRGDAWGVLLYEPRWLDGLHTLSPERLRWWATGLIRAPLDEAAARALFAAAPDRRCVALEIPDEDAPFTLGALTAWRARDWLVCDAGRELVVWDLAAREAIARNPIGAICRDGHPHFGIVVDEPTRTIATADGVREWALWNLDTLQLERVFRGHTEEVDGAVFLDDDRIVTGSGDGSLRLWDRATGACVRSLATRPIACLAGGRDNPLIATAGGSGRGDGEGLIWICDRELAVVREIRVPIAPATYRPLSPEMARGIGSVAERRDTAHIRAIAWHPDGRHVITGGWDFVVKMFDAHTGACVRRWSGHSFWVDALAVSDDGTRIATGSSDGRVHVWATDAEECLADFAPGGRIEGVCFAGGRVYASSSHGCVYVLP